MLSDNWFRNEMTLHSSLYEQAGSHLRASRRKLGISTLCIFTLAVSVAVDADTSLVKWCAAFLFVWAFFCFCRYAGDCRELEDLNKGLWMAPPPLPFSAATESDEAIVRGYGRVLERFAGKLIAPVGRLPASKERIKAALVRSTLAKAADAEACALLRQGYLGLCAFQPLCDGLAQLAELAATAEYHELDREWMTLFFTSPSVVFAAGHGG